MPRKSHTGFPIPLVLKSVTYNDLKRRNGRYFALRCLTEFDRSVANYITMVEVRPTVCERNVAKRSSFRQ